tara:strand:+ start:10086 stop:11624 length:1539 start_codon:yes stop_codon:yes gene_type:complete
MDQKILELTALYEISKAFASSLDLKVASNKVMDILSSVLGMRRGTLTLLHRETGELVIEVAHGLTSEEKKRGHYRVGEGITGKVMATGEPMVVPDIGQEPLFLNRTGARGDIEHENIAFLCMPVKVYGDTIGVLSVDRLFDDQTMLIDDDLRVLTIVAGQIGQAVKVTEMVTQERQRLIDRNQRLEHELQNKFHLRNVVGHDRKMEEVYESVDRVAETRATVLIRGESGTGKELIARAIHYGSARAGAPFIKVNCAAIPESLLESELFGHEKGAFTGAIETRKGRFEQAHEGTLFLDEVGDLPFALQPKFLRVLQEMQFERVGGSSTISVDVRIIAATHRDLERLLRDNMFREDLYYRLNVVPVYIPPLRERIADIPLLIEHFLQRFNTEHGKSVEFSQDAVEVMVQHKWLGNVRELENCLERAVIMTRNKVIDAKGLGGYMNLLLHSDLVVATDIEKQPHDYSLPGSVRAIEREQISEALRECGGVKARAAKLLGLTKRQIGYKIQKYNIE